MKKFDWISLMLAALLNEVIAVILHSCEEVAQGARAVA